MTMLGAHLDDLAALSSRLQAAAGDVGAGREQATTTTSHVVSEVGDAARRALEQITAQMESLGSSVAGAAAQADSTQWTGANADRFRQGAAEFRTAIEAGRAATTEAFTSFHASVATMTETLNQFVSDYSAALTHAESSAIDMANAVDSQRSNLDQVMNVGIAFG